jgi:hypothetical protein
MADLTNRSKFLRTLIRGIVFVVAAIPGVLIFLASVIFFLFYAIGTMEFSWSDSWLPLLGLPVGGVLILLGLGDLRKWPYLFVFSSIPVIFLLFFELMYVLGWGAFGFPGIFGGFLLAGIAFYFVFRKIDKCYKATRIEKG